MNHRAKFDDASFILAGEIRNYSNTHTHTHTKLDGKYSEGVQLPATAKFKVFVVNTWQQLLLDYCCKPAIVHILRSFLTLLPHPSTDRNETRNWFSISL